MEIKDFISETLQQIIQGVATSQEFLVNQKISATINKKNSRIGIQLVEFDIAVTTNETSENNLAGKVSVASIFNIGGGQKNENSTSNISRIKFSVPISLPNQSNDSSEPFVVS